MRSTVAPAASRRLPSSPSCKLSPLSTALASVGVLFVMPVQAQTSAAVSQSTVLEEVTVTGERSRSFSSKTVQVGTFRDQDPIDVPMTNNVVTREVLEAQGTGTVYGALRNTAGVAHAQIGAAAYDNIAIRGLLVDNRSNYRLNGSLPIINLIDTPMENKERVEVLKGAASLYYGLVPPSGIVNLITKRAGSTPVTSVATSVNNHGGADAHLDIGRRFGPDNAMGLRFNAVAGTQEIGVDHFEGRRSLVSLAHDWRVNRAVNVKFDVEHYRKNVSEPATLLLNANNPVVPVPVENSTNHAGEWQRYDAKATNWLLRTDISLADAWVLTLETGRAVTERDRNFSSLRNIDLTTGAADLNIGFVRNQRFENTNHRAELVGHLATGSLAHELTVGATTNERESRSASAASETVDQNYYNPRFIDPIVRTNWTAGAPGRIHDKGVYAFDRISFGERWQLLAGMRYSDYESRSGTAAPYTVTETSPNVSVIFKPTLDVSLYASYLEALEESGIAPTGRANVGEVLPPLVNKQKEVGVKARVLPSLMLQAAYFDILKPQTMTDADTNRFMVAGRSKYRGLELSASGELGRNWSVLASALLMDAEINRVASGTGNAALLGNTPQNTPKRTFSLFGEYRVPQVPGWALNAGAYHVGKRAVNNQNTAFIDDYTLLSFGTRYRWKWNGTAVTLQANVDNATDKDYWSSTGDNYLAAGLPRTVRVATKFDF